MILQTYLIQNYRFQLFVHRDVSRNFSIVGGLNSGKEQFRRTSSWRPSVKLSEATTIKYDLPSPESSESSIMKRQFVQILKV